MQVLRSARVLAVIILTITLGFAASADSGPSLNSLDKRLRKLDRQLRTVAALTVSTNDQVKVLQRDKGLVIQPVQASIPTGSGDTAGSANGDADCPPGYLATGGGAAFIDSRAGDHIVISEPHVVAGRPIGWSAAAVTYDQRNNTLLVEAICIRTG